MSVRTPSRRQVLAGIAASSGAVTLPRSVYGSSGAPPKLSIVGGGFGGATAARYLKHYIPYADVTLIEPNKTHTSCPFSNLVIGGERTLSQQEFTYAGLAKSGIQIVHALASAIDPARRIITLSDGVTLPYDRLVLSPGVQMRWNALEGYDANAAKILPHAWKAGPQTTLLRTQLESMEDGDLVVMSVPPAPYRCPPGPYERASLIAHYLKTQKPRSKLLILDSKEAFSKQPLFQEAWAEHYPDHIEWRSATEDGRVARIEATTHTVFTDFEDIKPSVANIIPPQRAGIIADKAGVADATGWCPINPISFASTLQPNIHVIGDASIASPMPKSAFSANLQAKVCALAIAGELAGHAPQATTLTNTCYSYTTPSQAVSISGVYSNENGALRTLPGTGGLSPLRGPISVREAEAIQARDWFSAITTEAFG